ncbi:MAG: serine/threonine-protein kinase, partial [Gemmataceae bacterium]
MPAPVNAQDFLEIARRSNQIDAALLEKYSGGPESGRDSSSPQLLASSMVRDGVLTLFQAEQFLLGKYKGFELGGYQILDRLGQGGTGVVYLARHEIMDRLAAIKVLPSSLADNSRYRALFQHEARAAATLHHPNVIQIHDFRKEGPLAYLIMEYIDGPNLQQILDQHGPLSIPQACEYARQAALGLHHAHEGGLIHRDVKPANLLVNPDGQVKVLDLGLALFRSGNNLAGFNPENSQMILGTADYLAPEQALNQNQVDARTDVYSLGATLHAMLCGKPPFHQGTIAQKLMWHQTKEPPAVHDIRKDVPAMLSALVRSMLEKSPQKRPTSAQEVALVLAGWATKEPRPSVPYPG